MVAEEKKIEKKNLIRTKIYEAMLILLRTVVYHVLCMYV